MSLFFFYNEMPVIKLNLFCVCFLFKHRTAFNNFLGSYELFPFQIKEKYNWNEMLSKRLPY